MSRDKLSNMEFVDLVVDLARDVESTDSTDWAMFPANEEDLYKLAATQIIESMNMITDRDDQIMMLLATTVKLVVENTVLNHQLVSRNTSFE